MRWLLMSLMLHCSEVPQDQTSHDQSLPAALKCLALALLQAANGRAKSHTC